MPVYYIVFCSSSYREGEDADLFWCFEFFAVMLTECIRNNGLNFFYKLESDLEF